MTVYVLTNYELLGHDTGTEEGTAAAWALSLLQPKWKWEQTG